MAAEDAGSNFVRAILEEHARTGVYGGSVVTRFPPEPNGYPHIGHAKAICLNFGMAAEFGGRTHLRFDDTNPETEDAAFVEVIARDIQWLGFDWGEHLFFASDSFPQLYDYALLLIRKGLAYVDSQTEDEIRAGRGTVTEPGTDSPFRSRLVDENLHLFQRMRAGDFEDGAHVLRARIDMSHANMKLRDPLLYRIRHAHHYRQGDAWPIYPFYDFAHCLSDAIEGITHSLCSLEFDNNRALYDWILDAVGIEEPRPHQYEFARLNLAHTVMSKRRLARLVGAGAVQGWDDPRMPTLSGMRRRGVRPEAIRAFCERIGVSKADSLVDPALLETMIRDDLNTEAPRVLCVLDPLRLVVDDWPEDRVDWLDAPSWPHDVGREGSRSVPFGRELLVERADFTETPDKRWRRLAPGVEVRLRHGYLVRCTSVERDADGTVIALHCTHDPDSRGGRAPDGRKVRGTLHWVSAAHGLPCTVRTYGPLFSAQRPGSERDWEEDLAPDSLQTWSDARIEPSVAQDPTDARYQFERQGYFWRDEDSRPDALVFNRIVALKDSFAPRAAAPQPRRPEPTPQSAPGDRPDLTPAQAADRDALVELGVGAEEAWVLATDAGLRSLFDGAQGRHDNARRNANLVVHVVPGAVPEGEALRFGGAELGALVALLDDGTVSSTAAKQVLAELVASGGDPAAIVADKGLAQVSDEDALSAIVAEVLAGSPEQVARYRGGNARLLGFFVGQVMKATKGRANPARAKELLAAALEG